MKMIKLSFVLSFKLKINFYIFFKFLDDYLFYDTLFFLNFILSIYCPILIITLII